MQFYVNEKRFAGVSKIKPLFREAPRESRIMNPTGREEIRRLSPGSF